MKGGSYEDHLDAKASPVLELRRMWAKGDAAASWSMLSAESSSDNRLATSRTRLEDEYFLYGIVPPAAPYQSPELPPGPLHDKAPHQGTISSFNEGTSVSMHAQGDVNVQTISFGAVFGARASGRSAKTDIGTRIFRPVFRPISPTSITSKRSRSSMATRLPC